MCYSDSSAATVKTYTAAGGIAAVGQPQFSSSIKGNPALAMHPNGQPHVAVVNGTSGLLSVLAFDGIRWSGVGGTPLFISNPRWSTASNPSIAISNAGQAYIAFTENENNNQLTVMTYTSSGGWTVVGERAISSESAFFINLAIHPLSNQPVVAYVGFQPHVLAFTGGRWTAMGSTPAEKVDNVNMLSLALHPYSGVPFVAFASTLGGRGVSVVAFNESNWTPVGAQIGQYSIRSISLCLHPTTASPFVAVVSAPYDSSYISVVRYDSSAGWTSVGAPNLFADSGVLGHWRQSTGVSLAISQQTGQPHMAFSDGSQGGKATVAAFSCSMALPPRPPLPSPFPPPLPRSPPPPPSPSPRPPPPSPPSPRPSPPLPPPPPNPRPPPRCGLVRQEGAYACCLL